MKVEEKLKHFTTITIENVQNKCDKELEEYKAQLDSKFEQHKTEALRLANLEEKSMREHIERKASKEFTTEQLHIRRTMNSKQDELRESLFKDVLDRIKEFRASDQYRPYLENQIKEAISFANGEEIHIYIDAGDEFMKQDLESKFGISLQVSNMPFGGGIRAEVPHRNILIDNTFETRLEEEREKFLIVI